MEILEADALTAIQTHLRQGASLLLYQAVFQDEVGVCFFDLLHALAAPARDPAARTIALQAYGHWFRAIAAQQHSWQTYVRSRLLLDENPFTQQAQRLAFQELPPALVAAAQHDLRILQQLATCEGNCLSHWLQTIYHLETAPIAWHLSNSDSLPLCLEFEIATDWGLVVEPLAAHYHQQGTGRLAQYTAFRWQAGELVGVPHPDPVQIADLVGYEWQKAALVKNTEFLLNGSPALHVLLYGSRGSGKSSLVKALLNHYHYRGLRLIEVAKSDLIALPTIVEPLRALPQKFMLFVDDLSFEADDDAYKALKVVLEGNITARPQNVVVYATSNRRHLIREFFGDRPRPQDADEVHQWDTVQEKLSFSDRFGLTLTFEPADQTTYLEIVRHLAAQAKLSLNPEALDAQALQWATRHNGRSGRTARQFIDFLQADLATPLKNQAEG